MAYAAAKNDSYPLFHPLGNHEEVNISKYGEKMEKRLGAKSIQLAICLECHFLPANVTEEPNMWFMPFAGNNNDNCRKLFKRKSVLRLKSLTQTFGSVIRANQTV